MLRLILLSGIVAHVLAETCDFKPFHECQRPSPPPGGRSGSPQPFSRGPRGKPPEFKCLEDAKCQFPTPPPRGSRPTQNPNDRAARDQAKECYKNVFKSVKADIQACVQKEVPDYKFPEPKPKSGTRKALRGGPVGREEPGGTEEQEGPGGPKGFGGNEGGERGGFEGPGGKGRGRGGIERLINISCTTPESKASALACVKALPLKVKNDKKKADRLTQTCERKTNCLKSLSPPCQQQFAKVEEAKCSCANSTITANKAKIEAQLEACRANLPTPSPRPERRGDKQKKGGSKVEQLVKMFCRRDPCKPQSK